MISGSLEKCQLFNFNWCILRDGRILQELFNFFLTSNATRVCQQGHFSDQVYHSFRRIFKHLCGYEFHGVSGRILIPVLHCAVCAL